MNILHVLPLEKLPEIIPPVISYYSTHGVKMGSLVLIMVNRRQMAALVIKSEDIAKQKINIKKYGFALKNIKGVICSYPILKEKQLKIISFIAKNLHISPNELVKMSLRWLPKNPERIKEFIQKHKLNLNLKNDGGGSSKINNLETRGFYGKDRIEKYAPLIKNMLNKHSVLMIAPTTYLAEYFYKKFSQIFPDQTLLFNSQSRSWKIYHDLFFKKNPEPKLVITTKFGILAPWKNLGLLILEKETMNFYNFASKNHINFKEAILQFANLHNIPCILADEAPSLEGYFKFKNGTFKLETPDVLKKVLLKKTSLIDLGQEKKLDRHFPFSQTALSIIKDSLRQKKKLIIFINKKGYSRAVMCKKCGLMLVCPECGLNFSAEKITETKIGLLCKNCSYRTVLPNFCPQCQFSSWEFIGTGTERLEAGLKKTFPQANIFRLDKTCAPNKKTFQKIAGDFATADSGILITTQIIFNQPDLQADNIIIISSDTAFFIPDYAGAEKILTNLIELENYAQEKIFWQTYQKNHSVVLSFYGKTFEDFADQELKLRQQFYFPPFAKIVKIVSRAKNSFGAKKKIEDFSQKINRQYMDKINKDIFISAAQPNTPFLAKNVFSYIIEIKVDLKENEKNPNIAFDIMEEARKNGLEANFDK